jgi:2-polyprenyl-3-methyl-5-hydroxy-6-metoxy-1,4-benzoquinol methylase
MTAVKEQIEYWIDTKTGKLKKEYDKLYIDHEDPWGCSKKHKHLYNKILLTCIEDKNPKRVLDIGCGSGDLSNEIFKLKMVQEMSAFDISRTAIDSAKEKFKGIDFFCADSPQNVKKKPYDVVVASEVIWYVSDEINDFLQAVRSLCKEGGAFIVKNYFPVKQIFSRDAIDGPNGFIELIKKNGLSVDKHIVMDSQIECENSVHIFVLLCMK